MRAASLIGIIILFFLLLPSAYAIEHWVWNHTITIQVNTDGRDTVVEKFFIGFPNDNEKASMRQQSMRIGTNLDAWKNINPLFAPSLGQNTTNKKIAYTEGELSYLQISYELLEPLMAKSKEATMMTEYTLKANFFNDFYQSGLWVIPENTSISIELPPGAEIRETVEPSATLSKNGSRTVVTWQGYKSNNRLTLNYILWKKLDPVIDLNAFNAFLFKTDAGLFLLIIATLIVLLVIWQRKKIVSSIETYVEKNSELREE